MATDKDRYLGWFIEGVRFGAGHGWTEGTTIEAAIEYAGGQHAAICSVVGKDPGDYEEFSRWFRAGAMAWNKVNSLPNLESIS